jgi:uncharacterized membrane protein YgdD (TMEM256/DUF423 family)
MVDIDTELDFPKTSSCDEWSEDLTPRGLAALTFVYLLLAIASAACGLAVKSSCENSRQILTVVAWFIFEALLCFVVGLARDHVSAESPYIAASLFFTGSAIWATSVVLTNFVRVIE